MGKKRFVYLIGYLTILLFIPTFLYPQSFVVKGKITDYNSKEPLVFVNISIKNTLRGTSSDINGDYYLAIDSSETTILFSIIGYEKYSIKVKPEKERTIHLDVSLKSTYQELNTTVISASKYAEKIEKSTASMDVIKSDNIDSKNITSADKAIENAPGVTIIDNEPQIRAGSGFSSGMGSRVMVLVDEIPMLRGDADRPVWNFLPVEDLDQIEIIKGASSVLYGSSASNGAINIRTSYPKDSSQTKIKVFSGVYSKPTPESATPWTGSNPLNYGASILHTQRFNDFDLVLCATFYNDQGYIGPMESTSTLAIDPNVKNIGDYNKFVKFNFGTRFRSKKYKGLTYRLNGNFFYSENAQTYFWLNDSTKNIYKSYPGALSNYKEFMYYLDPYLKYYNKNGATHSFRNRYYYLNSNADYNQSTTTYFVYDEYQYQNTLNFSPLGEMIFTAGAMNMFTNSNGKVFSGIDSAQSGHQTSINSDNFAFYTQLDTKLFRKLSWVLGGRWEYYEINSTSEQKPVFRTGLNFELTKATFLRASYGEGYRFPSIGEKYIFTQVGNFGFYPNPDLKSETSWNSEIGLKQYFKISSFIGYLDFAGFYQIYHNYIEFNAGLWGNSPDITKDLGFKYLNTGEASISGLDCSVAGLGSITDDIKFDILISYTYSLPQTLQPDYVYYQSKNNQIYSYAKTSTDTSNNILKYRIEHLAKFDLDLSFFKKITTGLTIRYYSFMQNIDNFFYELDKPGYFDTGITDYRETHDHGTFVFDYRIGYNIKKFKFGIIINNLLNTEYSLRPLTMEPPRTTSLQIIYKI